jgi:hypothetical protein
MRNLWHDRGDHFAVELWWRGWTGSGLNQASRGRVERLYALVDADGLEKMQGYRGTWSAISDKSGQTYYVRTTVLGKVSRRAVVYLHRLVTDCPHGLEPDHINHDGLDNRLSNLRIGTHKENLANRRAMRPKGTLAKVRKARGPILQRESVIPSLPPMSPSEARAYVLRKVWG